MDETEKMRQMNAWLDEVCQALDLDRATIADVQPALLDLVHDVAHGPSRPGAPLTAFLIGLAAGQHPAGSLSDAVRTEISKLEPLLKQR